MDNSKSAASDLKIPQPRISKPVNTLTWSLLQQMQQIQWWPRHKIVQNQLLEIRKLLQYARNHSPFYANRLQGMDLAKLGMEAFLDLPVLTRQDLQQQAGQIACDVVPTDHGGVEDMLTSGSTGTPVQIKSTGLVAAVWAAGAMRDHLWHRRDARLSNAALRWRVDDVALAPDGLSLPDWGPPHNQFYKTGPGFYLNSASTISDQLAWLEQCDPHYLLTHPSNLRALLLQMSRQRSHLSRLRQLRTVGEALPEDLCTWVSEVVDVPLVDCYSSQELGYIALQCPQYPVYHVQAENLLVEVINAQGQPCRPGETGRVVVTSLRNFATPLLRYALGDYARVGEACPCGRGLPVLERVHGRVRNMLRLADGSARWPNLGLREMMRVADLRQFQVVQRDYDYLEMKLVVSSRLDNKQEAAIKDILARYLKFPYRIDLSYHSALPRGANGKYEDFMSLLETE